MLSLAGGTGHDLATNWFAEAGKVLGHGVSSLVGLDITGGVAAVLVLEVGVTGIFSGGYSLTTLVRVASSSRDCVRGISWAFTLVRFCIAVLGLLYIVNGIGLG